MRAMCDLSPLRDSLRKGDRRVKLIMQIPEDLLRDVSYNSDRGDYAMANILINFNLTGDLAERYKKVEEKILSKPGKPPNRADIVKALMGHDPYRLLDGMERDYLSGRIDSLSEPTHVAARRGDRIEVVRKGKSN